VIPEPPDTDDRFRCSWCSRLLTRSELEFGVCGPCEADAENPPMEPEDDRG
jgi:hypothetical protein